LLGHQLPLVDSGFISDRADYGQIDTADKTWLEPVSSADG